MTVPAPRRLRPDEIHDGLLTGFRRRQQVTECWRSSPQGPVLAPAVFVEDGDASELVRVAGGLRAEGDEGGSVLVVEDGTQVVGFAAVGAHQFGTGERDRRLVELHVSEPYRGRGLGRTLLRVAAEDARRAGVGALYISAHSARETQAFYRAQGCVDAVESAAWLVEAEPCDVQLELALG